MIRSWFDWLTTNGCNRLTTNGPPLALSLSKGGLTTNETAPQRNRPATELPATGRPPGWLFRYGDFVIAFQPYFTTAYVPMKGTARK
jgi:hypothetical protein